MGAQAVFDPSIPARVRRVLEDEGTELTPAWLPPPGAGRYSPLFLTLLLVLGPITGFLVLVLPFLPFILGKAAIDAETRRRHAATIAGVQILQFVTYGSFVEHTETGSWLFLLPLGVGIGVVTWFIGARLGPTRAERLAYRYHGRYLMDGGSDGDFDDEASTDLWRAWSAVQTVLSASVLADGYLDRARNGVVLPAQLWDIASDLATQSRFRAEQRDLDARRPGPDARGLLAPQREALRRSTESTRERIDALTGYAAQVHAAEEAYREWQLLQSIPDQNAKYRELLARTVRDDLAADEIRDLDGDLTAAARVLQSALTTARRHAETLALPPR